MAMTAAQAFAFLSARAAPGANISGLDPGYAISVATALAAAEAATGDRASIQSAYRSEAQQAQLRSNYLNTPVNWDGEVYTPKGPDVGKYMAAPPGKSMHGKGEAVDLADGEVLSWLAANGSLFGITGLKGKGAINDPGHQQSGPTTITTAPSGYQGTSVNNAFNPTTSPFAIQGQNNTPTGIAAQQVATYNPFSYASDTSFDSGITNGIGNSLQGLGGKTSLSNLASVLSGVQDYAAQSNTRDSYDAPYYQMAELGRLTQPTQPAKTEIVQQPQKVNPQQWVQDQIAKLNPNLAKTLNRSKATGKSIAPTTLAQSLIGQQFAQAIAGPGNALGAPTVATNTAGGFGPMSTWSYGQAAGGGPISVSTYGTPSGATVGFATGATPGTYAGGGRVSATGGWSPF